MGSDLAVTRSALAAIHAHAEAAAPEEACGLLHGAGGRIERAEMAQNVAAERTRHFEIDPAVLIAALRAERAGTVALAGWYHSHPAGPPEPSAEDTRAAAGDGRVWAICGRVDGQFAVRFWRAGPEGFAALSHCVVDG